MQVPGEKPKKPDLEVTQAASGTPMGDQTIDAPSPLPASSPRPVTPRPMVMRPVHRPDVPAFDKPAVPGEVGMLGPYQIIKELGHGGMGAVYLANDTRLQRKLALKVMLPRFAAQPASKERFLREARAAAQISHDNVVTVYEADERNGVPYIAMQFLKGTSLDDYLTRKGNLPIGPVLRIGREAAQGLAAAHKIGLVHRDIKPGNLWLEAPVGRLKVLDFGLAKPLDSDVELTTSGMLVGTPVYMSPEQARGHQVDGRSDLFSLGGVLYRLCSGQLPFAGNTTMALLMALGTEDPKPLLSLNPEVPSALADLIHQMLEKNPENRPQNADEVVRRLRALADDVLSPRAPAEIDAATAVANFPEEPIHITAVASAPSGLQVVGGIAQKKIPQKVIWGVAALAALALGGVAFLVKESDNSTASITAVPGNVLPAPIAPPDSATPPPADVAATPPTASAKPAPTTQQSVARPAPTTQFASIPQVPIKTLIAPAGVASPTPPPSPSSTDTTVADVNRKAAEWILSSGGRLQTGAFVEITGRGELPKENFVVTRALLSYTRDANDNTIRNLANLPKLMTIAIDGLRVSDQGIASLKNLPNLVTLSARGTQITGAALVNFADTPSLVAVNLDACATDAGLAGVASCKSLKYLNLQSPQVTDAGLALLKTMPGLVRIDLKKSKVTRAGLAEFHAALPACKVEYDDGIIEPGSSFGTQSGAAGVARSAFDVLTSSDYEWTTPRALDKELNSGIGQGDAFISTNGLELWFSASKDEVYGTDLWFSHRTSIDAPWETAVNAGPQVNSKAWDLLPHLSADGLNLIFWHLQNTRAYQATRTSLQSPWTQAVEINGTQGCEAPLPSADALEMFLSFKGKISRTTRRYRRAAWQKPVPVDELNDDAWLQARWLSPDGLTILVSSGTEKGQPNLWLSQRAAPGKPWGPKTKFQTPPGGEFALYPAVFLMPNGLEFYFSRDGKIQVATRVQKSTPIVNPNRRSAELAISLGGKVGIAGRRGYIRRVSDLPADFALTRVVLFSNKCVTEADLDDIAQASEVSELGLYATATTDRSLRNIKNLKKLTFLDLGATHITDDGLDQIKGLTALTSLSLHYTPVSTGWLKNLQNFTALENLNLTRAVDDAGLAQVARVPTLQTIVMEASAITDVGFMQLQVLKSLRSVDVKNTRISADAAQKLHAALPKCRIEYDGGVIEAAAPLNAN